MRLAAAACVLLISIGGAGVCAAERTPPMPIPRPRSPGAPSPAISPPAGPQAPAASPADPLATLGIDHQPTGSTAAHDPIAALSVHPREEQRAILRRCIVEWSRKKREGSARGIIWRDFLETCIARN